MSEEVCEMSIFHLMDRMDENYDHFGCWHAFVVNNIYLKVWYRAGAIDGDEYARLSQYNRDCLMTMED